MKKFNILLALSFCSANLFAQSDEVAVKAPSAEPGLGVNSTELLIILSLVFLVLMFYVASALLKAFKVMYQEQLNPTPYQEPVKIEPLDYNSWLKLDKKGPSIWTKLLGLKPIEQEKDMTIDHAYDGIHELDNPVPGWFNFLFYGTMIFAAGYLFYYHIGGYGDLQDTEYVKEMEKADADKAIYLATAANLIDESTVKLDLSPAILTEGKNIYNNNCMVCHGDKGQGIIGPNLTDEFWIHGGGVSNIFKTIKYGVLDKGMVSWEKTLSPKQISAVTNYIMSLQGSNPAGAKAAQGEKYVEEVGTEQAEQKDATK